MGNSAGSGGTQILHAAKNGIPMALETELAVFENHRLEWCREYMGKFAVIQDETVLEKFFDEWEFALKAGYANFGVGRPFLVKEIRETDRVEFIGAA